MSETFIKVSARLRDRLKELNDTELRLLLALGLRVNAERQCWPTLTLLAQECLRSERQIQRAIGQLLAKNFIWVGRRAGGRGKANIYTLNGYFAFGSQPIQTMAPFMVPPPVPGEKGDIPIVANPQKGDMGVIVNPPKGDMGVTVKAEVPPEKGDIPIVANLQKGDMGVAKRVTSPQSEQLCKKNHIRRTINKEEGARASPGPDPRVTEIMKTLGAERGWASGVSPCYAAEAAAIKWMLSHGYIPEDILACWRGMASNPWWQGKPLYLMSVKKQIGAWQKGAKDGKGQRDSPETAPGFRVGHRPREGTSEENARLAAEAGQVRGATWDPAELAELDPKDE